MSFPSRPKVVVSSCLEFDSCRYDGQRVSSPAVLHLMEHVEFIPVCPELEMGLGVPRDPIRIVSVRGGLCLIQPATSKDFTGEMKAFVDSFLDSLGEVDGFILKNRSPSCGIGDVKIFSRADAELPTGLGDGFFGGEVMKRFGHLVVEAEDRLNDIEVRERFLAKLFALHRSRLSDYNSRLR
ncbi:MAG: DUF523 domain-containing protein [Candidatus Krumholzibacteria bacterium]|nr:DUF523 domain-containing protein [Candidatus Krumholzibacteria bacterium]